MELRVDLTELVALTGPGETLIDRLDRCRVVGCAGSACYLATRGFNRRWTVLVRDPELSAAVVVANRAREMNRTPSLSQN
jgi:hypothetical protein